MKKEIAPDPFLNAEFDKGPHKIITVQFNGSSEEVEAVISDILDRPGVVCADWEYQS